MRAGLLRHRVIIKRPESGRDAAGAAIDVLVVVATIWANVGFASGRERWANEHVLNSYSAIVTVRYRADLREDMEIHYDGRVLDIKAIIDPFGNKAELKLMCTDHA